MKNNLSSSCIFLIIIIVVILLLQDTKLETFENHMQQETSCVADSSVWQTQSQQFNNNIINHNDINNNIENQFFFSDTDFRGDCCPSQYSTSSGCACLSQDKKDFLSSRGGNRII